MWVPFKQYEKHLMEFPIIQKIKGDQVLLEKPKIPFDRNRIYFFPICKYFMSIGQIKKLYADLLMAKTKQTNEPIIQKLIKTDGKFYGFNVNDFVVFDYKYEYTFIYLVDYFMEPIRLLCYRNNQTENFAEWFNRNRELIAARCRPISLEKIINYCMANFTICSEFDPCWSILIINYFRQFTPINKVLDMSAGRGARLIGAIAAGCDYLGVDPCNATHEFYESVGEFYNSISAKPIMYEVINSGFEDNWKSEKFKINNSNNNAENNNSNNNAENNNSNNNAEKNGSAENVGFDLMFSSPPYFDLEIFGNEEGQSTKKFPVLEIWLKDFLFKCMDKIATLLRPGGIMAINIDNPRHQDLDYVNPMIRYTPPEMKYLGLITIARPHTKYSVWVYQKNE